MKNIKKASSDLSISILFLTPILVLILCITIIPIIIAFRTSMHATNYAAVGNFIGLTNYISILTSKEGWSSILNSITYVLSSLAIVMPLGVITGTLLNRKIKGISALRTMIIIPWVISQTVAALLWKWLLNGNYGPVFYTIYNLTGVKVDFFNSALSAKLTVVLANVWNSFPVVVILTLAALQTVSKDVYEAAKVDGATGLTIYTRITLPLIKPTLTTAVVMQSMEYFNMVTLIYVLTAGGPLGATETISVKAFRQAFDFWHLGTGSAYSVIIFLLNIVFSLFYIKMMSSPKDASLKPAKVKGR